MNSTKTETTFTEDVIITGLRSHDGRKSDRALLHLHQRMFGTVARYIQSNSGTAEDAEDVFQEGLFSFYKSIKTNKIQVPENIDAYLFSVCRNIWLKQIKKQKLKIDLTVELPLEMSNDTEVGYWDEDVGPSLLDHVEKHLGEKSRQLLSYFYYEKRPMKEIAQLLGLANEQVAKNKKSLCLKKLKELIRENPAFREVFNRP